LGLNICVFQYNSPFLSSCKRIVFIYDVIFKTSPQFFTIWERLYFYPIKFLSKRAEKVCTISESEKKRIANLKFSSINKIDVVYCGVSNQYVPKSQLNPVFLQSTKEKYKLPQNYILYVGRLNERKNISNLLIGFSLIKNKSISLVLGGTYDWKMFNIYKKVKDLLLEDRVVLTGFIDDAYLPAVYSLAKIFCYVSYDEGFGLPPLEAMASGIPVVVGNTGSLPEICGEAGNYVDPHNPRDIADMIDKILDEHDIYKKKKEIGLEIAERFTWQKSAETLFRCIETTFKS
jgi:glycosyltransferase involved in cell wall biosynthesis